MTSQPRRLRSGLFFDSRCLLHHCNYNHSESPQRVIATYEKLVNSNLWNQCKHLQLEGCSVIDSFTKTSDDASPRLHAPRKHLYGAQSLFSLDTTLSFESISQQQQKYNFEPSNAVPAFPQPSRLAPTLTITPQFNPLHTEPRALLTNAVLNLVHDVGHVNFVQNTAFLDFGADELDSEAEDDDAMYPDVKLFSNDTFVNKFSADAALVGATGVVELTRAVCSSLIDNAIAVIRPPGHHAGSLPSETPFSELLEANQGIMGFCLYNNVALAARAAQAEFPNTIRKVLIVDFDVHHGNGTQNIFYEDDSVLFFSIHRFTPGFFPETGHYTEMGSGKGLATTVNFPVTTTAANDDDYLAVFTRLFLPIAKSFQPDLILVSAGMDLLAGDPLGGMNITPQCLYQITRLLQEIPTNHHNIPTTHLETDEIATNHNNKAEIFEDESETSPPPSSKIVVCLEGGYNPHVVAEGMMQITRALIEPIQDPAQSQTCERGSFDPFSFSPNTVCNVTHRNSPEILELYETLDTVIRQFSEFYPIE